jgi:hypothetical protein
LVDILRKRAENQQTMLSAVTTLFLSPIAYFSPHLPIRIFSGSQKAVYMSEDYPIFSPEGVPNFVLILSILRFYQHHLDHIQHNLGAMTREALSWHNVRIAGVRAFQPTPPVTKADFHDDPSKIEGDWIGLYSYLGWADFEALRDGNPAILEANRQGLLRDYIGGPQRLNLRLSRQAPQGDRADYISANSIIIVGEGVNGGSFTLKGKLRKVYLPGYIFGEEKYLYWRVTFSKTYADGENSWTRWIYDGIFCPGLFLNGVILNERGWNYWSMARWNRTCGTRGDRTLLALAPE